MNTQVEIVTIGDELLIGQVVDTNSAWIGQQINLAGFSVNRITSVSDNEQEILSILKETTERSAIVLITGGLGPTRDDITKKCLCEFFNTKLILNQDVLADIQSFLKGRVAQINQLNHDQALVPENCTVIRNPIGTAPIMWFNYNKGVVVSMPGVPSEMKLAMEMEIIPRIKKTFINQAILHKTVHIFNIPEAVLAEKLTLWEDNIPSCIKVAYLPSPGKIRLRLTGKGTDSILLQNHINKAINDLYSIVGENIYGFDDEQVEASLLKLLLNKESTLSCAESCSGGYMAHLLTTVAGASKVFKGSAVAYANEIKSGLLGVSNTDIETFGAVSCQVVEQMALGACKTFNTHYAIATSGIAGPSGGTEEKPVGTVWIAWAGNGKVISQKFQFGNNRQRTIIRTAEAGIILLKQFIENNRL